MYIDINVRVGACCTWRNSIKSLLDFWEGYELKCLALFWSGIAVLWSLFESIKWYRLKKLS